MAGYRCFFSALLFVFFVVQSNTQSPEPTRLRHFVEQNKRDDFADAFKQSHYEARKGLNKIDISKDLPDPNKEFDNDFDDDDDDDSLLPIIKEVPKYQWIHTSKKGLASGGQTQLELFPPHYYAAQFKYVKAKPWSHPPMALSALPLLEQRLGPVLARKMTPAPKGWKREMSIQEDRPDGFPALAFAHVEELPPLDITAVYTKDTDEFLVKRQQQVATDDDITFSAQLEGALKSWVKKRVAEKRSSSKTEKFYFGAQLRHDIACAQVTSTLVPEDESKTAIETKQTLMARMYFARLFPVEAVSEDDGTNDSKDKKSKFGKSSYGGFGSWSSSALNLLQLSDNITPNTTNSITPNTTDASSMEIRPSSFMEFHPSSFLQKPPKFTVDDPIGIVALSIEGQLLTLAGGSPQTVQVMKKVANSFGLASVKAEFPCKASEILESAGIAESCIFSPNYRRSKIPIGYTGERFMMQCLDRHPIKSWIIYRQLKETRRVRKGKKVVKKASVAEQWEMRVCTSKGWTTPRAAPTGAQTFARCKDEQGAGNLF